MVVLSLKKILGYRIAGNFRGRKLSSDFEVLEPSTKFGGVPHPPMIAICESFLCKILISYGSAKVFSLESLPLYGS